MARKSRDELVGVAVPELQPLSSCVWGLGFIVFRLGAWFSVAIPELQPLSGVLGFVGLRFGVAVAIPEL